MTMNLRSDLPIKYQLNLYNEEGLNDEFTLLYEISQYIIRVAESKGRDLDTNSVKFSSKSLKYIFPEKIKDETFKAYLVKSLKKMIVEGYLAAKGEFIFFTKKGLTYFYTLND